jgi:hypothetical protein
MPSFWVGECYFWPNYLPWKWRITSLEFYFAGAGVFVHAPFPLITNPVEVVGGHQAIWRIPITWTPLADLFVMRVFDDTHLMQKTVVWKFELYLASVMIDVGYCSGSAPTVGVPLFFSLFFGDDPYNPVVDRGDMVVRPATYAQGGSPWS